MCVYTYIYIYIDVLWYLFLFYFLLNWLSGALVKVGGVDFIGYLPWPPRLRPPLRSAAARSISMNYVVSTIYAGSEKRANSRAQIKQNYFKAEVLSTYKVTQTNDLAKQVSYVYIHQWNYTLIYIYIYIYMRIYIYMCIYIYITIYV